MQQDRVICMWISIDILTSSNSERSPSGSTQALKNKVYNFNFPKKQIIPDKEIAKKNTHCNSLKAKGSYTS